MRIGFDHFSKPTDSQVRAMGKKRLRNIINDLRSYYIDYYDIEKKYGINFKEYFRTEVENLDEFVRDGIIKASDHEIIITDLGQQFTDLVCRHFDAYI